ncbi:uncharacterized protein B0H18DRAFT_960217 [Fomitopsis serialis]|uniref:uncharacterized protein n=1 Tax=Fomitopsis serialis TaxID=139415 RepID=UPI002008A73A|nr:uncharacterized protein B0H18DRAFT_960217 [Neoantrodia serialis]KAH9913644.1 hypothetical protein B0H18DRAFT_960217 [Neoantrodia serialis]
MDLDEPAVPPGLPGEMRLEDEEYLWFSKHYQFGIPASVLESIEGTLVDAPRRLEEMPPTFRLHEPHPSLVGRGLTVNNSYVQIMDTCQQAAMAWAQQEAHWPVPGETPRDATDEDWLYIGARDYLHVRPARVWVDGELVPNLGHEHNVLAVTVIAEQDMAPSAVETYNSLGSRIVSGVSDVDDLLAAPEYDRVKKRWVNGADVERLFREREGIPEIGKEKPAARVYNIGQSHQRSRNLIGPSIGAKRFTEDEVEEPEDLSIRRELNKASLANLLQLDALIDNGVHVMKMVVPETYKMLHDVQRMHGSFCMGDLDNVCFSSSQLNVSAPQHLHQIREGKNDLSESLGQFGGLHRDPNDCVGAYSTMTIFSQLDEDIEHGYFMHYELGAFSSMPHRENQYNSRILTVLFSGLRKHGGTPPFVRNPETPIGRCLRLNHIMYHMSGILDGKARVPLGALGERDPIIIPPEAYNPDFDDQATLSSQPCNLQLDARSLADERSASTAAVVGLYLMVQKLWKHTGPTAQIDIHKFFEAFTSEDAEGNQVSYTDQDILDYLPVPDREHPNSKLRHEIQQWNAHRERPDVVDIRNVLQGEEDEQVDLQVGRVGKSKKKFGADSGEHMAPKSKSKKRKDAKSTDNDRPSQRACLDSGADEPVMPDLAAHPHPTVHGVNAVAGPSQHGSGEEGNLRCSSRIKGAAGLFRPYSGGAAAPVQLNDSNEEDGDPEVEALVSDDESSEKSHQGVLALFGLDNISASVRTLQGLSDSLPDMTQRYTAQNAEHLRSLMQAFEVPSSTQACSSEYAVMLKQSWPIIDGFQKWDQFQRHKHAELRCEAMLAESYSWLWLNTVMHNHCRELLTARQHSKSQPPTTWLAKLAVKVYDSFGRRKGEMLCRSTFLPELPAMSVTLPKKTVRKDERIDAVVEIIHGIVRTWLEFPKLTSFLRALFVSTLVTAFHTNDVLLLDGVWAVWCSPRPSLLPAALRRTERINDNSIAGLRSDLASLPVLSNPEVPEYQQFRLFCRLLAGIRSGTPIRTNPVDVEDLCKLGLLRLRDFVMECLAYVPHLINKSIPLPEPLSALQKWCMEDEDHRVPFRELAAGRKMMMSDAGPFHPFNIHKLGALASACIHLPWHYLLFTSLLPVVMQTSHTTFATLRDMALTAVTVRPRTLQRTLRKRLSTPRSFCARSR